MTPLSVEGGSVSTAIDLPPGYKADMTSYSYAKLKSANIEPEFDTEKQAVVLLEHIREELKTKGMKLKDVVQVRAYLAPDPNKENQPDYAGWNKAYKIFFGTDKAPKRPVRTTVVVDSLPTPGAFVRVEVITVSKIKSSDGVDYLKK